MRKFLAPFLSALALVACDARKINAPCSDPVISVSLSADTIFVGQSKSLAAAWQPNDASVNSVTWASSATSVATVSNTGVITGVAVGETSVTVKVTCCDGTVSKETTAKVVVRERPKLPTTIVVAPDTVRMYVGDKTRASAAVSGEPGISLSVLWTSETPTIATVSNTGEITGVSPGTAGIRARAAADTTKSGRVVVIVAKVPDPVPSPTLTLSVKSSRIVVGDTAKVSWASTGTTTCMRSSVPVIPAWSGVSATTGSQDLVGVPVGKYDITQFCTGSGGSVTATVTFEVTSAPPPPASSPTATISANPSRFVVGATTSVTWASQNTTSCTKSATPAIGGWSGSAAVSGSQTLSGLAVGLYTVTVTCPGAGGTAVASTTVEVTNEPASATELVVRFAASRAVVEVNQGVFLSGEAIGAKNCVATSNPRAALWTGSKPTTPFSIEVGFTAPGTYRMSYTCTSLNGLHTSTNSIDIRVVEKTEPPPQEGKYVLGITISPKTVTLKKGESQQFAVIVTAEEGVTKAFECESTNPAFGRATKIEGGCKVEILADSPNADVRFQVIARTIGLARSDSGRLLPLEASALISVLKVEK